MYKSSARDLQQYIMARMPSDCSEKLVARPAVAARASGRSEVAGAAAVRDRAVAGEASAALPLASASAASAIGGGCALIGADAAAAVAAKREPEPETELKDKSLDDMTIVKSLGSGSFGAVYLVRVGSQQYAAKLVKAARLRRQKLRGEADEFRILCELRHPCIVQVYALLSAGAKRPSQMMIVMEALSGGSLLDQLRSRRRMSESSAGSWIAQLIRGLSYIHGRGIVHRDIKPSNLMLDASETQLKIIDFGCAVKMKSGGTIRGVSGTSGFRAPEVLRGPYTSSCDIYSAGCCLRALCKLRDRSPAHRDCLEQMLAKSARKRITAERLLAHPFIKQWL